MNPLHVLIACLAASMHAAGIRGADSTASTLHTPPLRGKSLTPVARAKAHAVSELLETTKRTAQQSNVVSGSASRYLAVSSSVTASVLWRVASEPSLGMVIFMVALLTCFLCFLFSIANNSLRPSPAQDLLNQDFFKRPPEILTDDKVPERSGAPPPSRDLLPSSAPVASSLRSSESALQTRPPPSTNGGPPSSANGGGFLASLGNFNPFSTSVESTVVQSDERAHLVPEMVVAEPQGARFFIDGELTNEEQAGFIDVWHAKSEANQKQVMKLMLGEGCSGPGGHHNGITLEILDLCTTPIALLNTQFAIDRGTSLRGISKTKRRITIFDTFSGKEDTNSPFCIAERESRGVTLRRVSDGKVLCVISSGGYNTDFGNIVDGQGRLIATSSNRGHSLFGLGLVVGSWTQHRRTVQVAQGVDVALIVCAIVCAAKLADNPGISPR